MDELTGTPSVLPPRFRIIRELRGHSGQGRLFVVEDSHVEQGRGPRGRDRSRRVVKLCRPANRPATEQDRRRLWREFTLASGIHDPQVIKVFDHARDETYGDYFVMQHYEGAHDLRQHLQAGVLSPDQALALLLGAARGVAAAHAAYIAHRDIKPSNFLLVPEVGGPRVVLLDFGIGESFAKSEHFDPITQIGQLSPMTPVYAAPEQWRGGALGPEPDLFSLGMLAFELLTGSPAFSQDQISTGLAGELPARPLPPETPRSVRRVIQSLVSPDPAVRRSAATLVEALEAAGVSRRQRPLDDRTLASEEATMPQAPVGSKSGARRRLRKVLGWLWTVAGVLAVIAGITGVTLDRFPFFNKDVVLVPGKRIKQLLKTLTPADRCVALPRLQHDVDGKFTADILAPAVAKAANARARIPVRSGGAEDPATAQPCRVRVSGTLYSPGYDGRAPIVELSTSRFDEATHAWPTVETVRMDDGKGVMFPLLFPPLSFNSLVDGRYANTRRVTGDTDPNHQCGGMSRSTLAESAVRKALRHLGAGEARIRILRQTVTEVGSSDFVADLAVVFVPDGIPVDELTACAEP